MHKLKIVCKTPDWISNSAEKAAESFGMRYFSALKKPIETKIIDKGTFYYIYEYEKEKDMYKIIQGKIPKAEATIRKFYLIVIGLVKRANKMGKKGAWTIEKTRRWILRQFSKKGGDSKEMENFIDAIELEDLDLMMKFLTEELFTYEIL